MPFVIDPMNRPQRQVRAAARERLDLAIDTLAEIERDPDADVEHAVHEVRKRCKETRALARLVRPAIGPEFGRFDRRVRDAARELSSIRDAHAILVTLDDLRTARDLAGDEALTAVRDRQEAHASAATESIGPGDARIRSAAELLIAARKLVRRWEIDDPTWLEDGLGQSYRRARRGLRDARREPTDDHFHEWRKGVKTLWYQMRLIEAAAPSVLGPLIMRLDDLSDSLGDDHDLAVLIARLEHEPDDHGGPDDVLVAARHARDQQAELRARSFRLGATLFAERTGAFVARIGAYWRAAAELGPELPTGGIAELVADEQRRDTSPAGHEHLERERKFLVDTLPVLPAGGRDLRQGYLAIDGTVSVRVRDESTRGATLTVKAGRGAVRTELEWPITAEEFETAWARTDGRRVHKTRYLVDITGSQPAGTATGADVDVFHGDLDGLVIVEVGFTDDAEMAAFTPPAWFGREVTDDPAFTNASLAVTGCPPL